VRYFIKAVRQLALTLSGILKELSDESAYARHLRIHGVKHSAEEWRRFSDARLRAKFVRPKCC
jgi:hypothetical protein